MLGIYIKRSADTHTPAQAVIVTALFGMALLTAGILTQMIRRKVY